MNYRPKDTNCEHNDHEKQIWKTEIVNMSGKDTICEDRKGEGMHCKDTNFKDGNCENTQCEYELSIYVVVFFKTRPMKAGTVKIYKHTVCEDTNCEYEL